MLFSDPPATRGDLHFRIGRFPIRVTPFFWLIGLLTAPRGDERVDPKSAMIWIGAVFVSILIHELGHAIMQRRFGGEPRIVLYHLGGLAIEGGYGVERSSREQIMISAAGPIAGFLFAIVVLVVLGIAGVAWEFVSQGERGVGLPLWSLFGISIQAEPFGSRYAMELVGSLLFINISWGLINLLPVYPLDGGQIARELFLDWNPGRGIVQSLWLSAASAAAMAFFALVKGWFIVTLMFALLAYGSYQTLRRYEGGGYGSY